MIAFTILSETINLVIDGVPHTLPRDSAQARQVLDGIRRGATEAELKSLLSVEDTVCRKSGGRITVKDGVTRVDGEEIPKVLADRVMSLLRDDLPYDYVLNFWARLRKNPSRRAVQEFYQFLENKNLTITATGMVLGYKAVRNDWKDKFSGTFSNHPGAQLSMPRNKVCDDADIGCSYGFHVGSLNYVKGFAYGYGCEGGDRIVIVEFDPANVVSVPKDCECQKVRVCAYRVVEEFKGILPDYAPSGDDAYTIYDLMDEDDEDEDEDRVQIEIDEAYENGVAEGRRQALEAAVKALRGG